MKKLLLLLLLVPMVNAEDTWDDFIKRNSDSLTEIVCKSSGVSRRWASLAEAEDPIAYTDYFVFNDDYLFMRAEIMGFDTIALKMHDITADNEMSKTTVKLTDNIIQVQQTAKANGLALLSDTKLRYELYETTYFINRETGSYKHQYNDSAYNNDLKKLFLY